MSAREINENAAPFPSWLAARVPRGEWPVTDFHAELALIERTVFECTVSRSSASDPWTLRGRILNPVLEIVQLLYPIADFLDARVRSCTSGSAVDIHGFLQPLPSPETLLIIRDPVSLAPRILRGVPHLLLVLKLFAERIPEETLPALGLAGPTLETAMAEAVSNGLLIEWPPKDSFS